MILRLCRLLTYCLLILVIGCGTNHKSPLPRLEQDYPVGSDVLRVSQCRVDGIEVDDATPIHTKRGKPFVLTGIIESGTWNTKSIVPGWRYEGHSFNFKKTEPRLLLSLFLHGNDTSKNLGVIESLLMEARPLKRPDESKMEFRVTINPPKYRGCYVIDVQAGDEHAVLPKDRDRSKLIGVAIWRRELWVE